MTFSTYAEQLAQIRLDAICRLQRWADQFLGHPVRIVSEDGTEIYRGVALDAKPSATNLSITFAFREKLILFPSDSKWKIFLEKS